MSFSENKMSSQLLADRMKSKSNKSTCPGCHGEQGEFFLSAPDRFNGETHPYCLMRCPSCTLVWLKDPPPPQEIGRHYGADYDRIVGGAGEDPNRWRDRRDYLLRHKRNGTILDLGCSAGGFLTSMKGPEWELY